MSSVVHQIARPHGSPTGAEFALVTGPTPTPTPGTALVENLYLSVDPYMRQVMDDGDLHAPMEGRALGRIVASLDPALPVGGLVFHRHGWRTHALVTPADSRPLPDLPGVPLSAHLGVLGGTGLSAYVGLVRIAQLRPGETVFISAAAGAVGSAAGQLARLLGASRVIGSTGSAAKARHLTDALGFDAALDYRAGDLTGQLAKAAPDGIDVYLDNVGGDHLEAAIASLREHGRIAWCGAVAQYSSLEPPAAPRNLFEVMAKSLRLEGFLVREHLDARPALEELLVPHIQSGRVSVDETVVDGIDNMVSAFLGMLRGENLGKMIVRL
ncbi:NADP-dependent oxidoreductase [Longispora sp. NPDC051575]|uniref:NADP-dependent oxidoreductase n=1 Tax=Longispora sp. NPDC051575 TaxID=3154943 RepID=UPI003433DAA6